MGTKQYSCNTKGSHTGTQRQRGRHRHTENKTKQNKTKQNKTKQNKPCLDTNEVMSPELLASARRMEVKVPRDICAGLAHDGMHACAVELVLHKRCDVVHLAMGHEPAVVLAVVAPDLTHGEDPLVAAAVSLLTHALLNVGCLDAAGRTRLVRAHVVALWACIALWVALQRRGININRHGRQRLLGS